jgi:hypothetical protein
VRAHSPPSALLEALADVVSMLLEGDQKNDTPQSRSLTRADAIDGADAQATHPEAHRRERHELSHSAD